MGIGGPVQDGDEPVLETGVFSLRPLPGPFSDLGFFLFFFLNRAGLLGLAQCRAVEMIVLLGERVTWQVAGLVIEFLGLKATVEEAPRGCLRSGFFFGSRS